MNTAFRRAIAFVIFVSVSAGVASTARAADAALRLPAAGTFKGGGEFVGTVTINRFEQRNNDIVAIGFVSGTLIRGNKPIGTAVAGPVRWPVTVRTGSSVGDDEITAQASCPVAHVALGPVDVNLLGVQTTLSAVTFDLGGEQGTPLGDLVCSVNRLLGNVAGLVNVLNSLLGLVTGLLGGLGGLVPGA
jgi:hypothetical protein